MYKKQFVCIWGTGYVDSPKTEVHEHTWFLEGRGYDASMYDILMELDEHEEADFSDISGYHVVFRIRDLEFKPDDRTAAKFAAWKAGKVYNNDRHTIRYPDDTLISMSEPTYTVIVGNREMQTDDLDEAERYLWNEWVAGQEECGHV